MPPGRDRVNRFPAVLLVPAPAADSASTICSPRPCRLSADASRLTGPSGEESDTATVTASGFQTCVRVTPIVSVPSPQTCLTALVTSSDVMISASSAYSPSPWKPSAARTWKRAIRTDSGMFGKTNAINRGSTFTAVPAMALVPSSCVVAACTFWARRLVVIDGEWQIVGRLGKPGLHYERAPGRRTP